MSTPPVRRPGTQRQPDWLEAGARSGASRLSGRSGDPSDRPDSLRARVARPLATARSATAAGDVGGQDDRRAAVTALPQPGVERDLAEQRHGGADGLGERVGDGLAALLPKIS